MLSDLFDALKEAGMNTAEVLEFMQGLRDKKKESWNEYIEEKAEFHNLCVDCFEELILKSSRLLDEHGSYEEFFMECPACHWSNER